MWRRDVPKRAEQEVSLPELVQSIADQLKPWSGSLKQSQVLAEITSTIEWLKNPSLSHFLSRLIGSSRKSREKAKRLRATLNQLEEQLADIGCTFHIVISPENQVGLWTPQRTIGEIHNAFYEVMSKGDSRFDERRLAVAFAARLLMKNLSTKKPTIPSDGNSPFCMIASFLFEAVTGEGRRNLISACRRVYRLRSEHI
jgi:hypothetical protein